MQTLTTIVKTSVQEMVEKEIDCTGYDLNGLDFNTEEKRISSKIEYYDAEGNVVNTSSVVIEGDDYDLWVANNVALVKSIRSALLVESISQGKLPADTTDGWP